MEKNSSPEPIPLKSSIQGSSDLQPPDEAITFISISHYEMHKLVHDAQHFLQKVVSLNRQAKKQIDLGAYKQALSLLSEAQKILEYAAGSGKTIERDLIICILHNIATAYHKLWMLQKCLRYIEGVIFNLESCLQSVQNSVASSNHNQQMQLAIQSLQMKNLLTDYCLKFCALNSQQQNHKEALVASRKAIGYMRYVLTYDEALTRNLLKQGNEQEQHIQLKHRLLIEILDFENNLNLKKQKDVLKAAHFSYQIWNKQKQKMNNNYFKFLKNYSIGDFMQLRPKDFKSTDKLKEQEKILQNFQSSIVFKILLLSISFFSTATEIRLNLSQQQHYSQLQKETSVQFLQSEIYHLLAIITITAFLPIDILYLKHLISSYSNYFNSGLLDYKTVEPQSYEKILELLSDNKYKSFVPGSTQIISSEEVIPQLENNDYRLKDRFLQKLKKQHNNVSRHRKPLDKTEKKNSKSNSSNKNFSSLGSKSIIKEEKRISRAKNKLDSKLKEKTRSKNKTKSKTLEKKAKQKEQYYFVKVNSKSKRKYPDQQLGFISKKVSPKNKRQHPFVKEIVNSEIVSKQRKKSLNRRISTKKFMHDHKSPRRRQNVYGLQY